MITWERISLPFLQNQLILDRGVDEHFYKGLDGTCEERAVREQRAAGKGRRDVGYIC